MQYTRLPWSAKPKYVALASILGLVLISVGDGSAHPGGGSGATGASHQHGEPTGHLVGSGAFGNIEFVGKLRV